MGLKIKRFNMDIGNSMTFAMIDGDQNILEVPTSVVPLTESKAMGYFAEDVAKSELKNSLLLKVDDEYLLVGSAAQKMLGNDSHIRSEIHEKSTSPLSEHMFFALLAIYDAEQNTEDEEETKIEIDYFSTMLPIFEVLSAEKFSDKTEEMAKRFKKNFSFEIITNGCQKKISVKTKESKCLIEGSVAKYALKYDFDLREAEAAEGFDKNITINSDLGGGTIDQVRLPKRLMNPKSRDDFKTITEAPFLGAITELYEQKLRKHNFKSVRDVEEFIIRNYESGKYVIVDGNTGVKTDITAIIEESLREYTQKVLERIFSSYPSVQGEIYKYNYFGGVAPILRKYIEEYVTDKFGSDIFEEYHHIEPDRTARFLNLYGLEIVSRKSTLTK